MLNLDRLRPVRFVDVHQSLRRTLGQQPDHECELIELLNPRQVADVFPNQSIEPK